MSQMDSDIHINIIGEYLIIQVGNGWNVMQKPRKQLLWPLNRIWEFNVGFLNFICLEIFWVISDYICQTKYLSVKKHIYRGKKKFGICHYMDKTYAQRVEGFEKGYRSFGWSGLVPPVGEHVYWVFNDVQRVLVLPAGRKAKAGSIFGEYLKIIEGSFWGHFYGLIGTYDCETLSLGSWDCGHFPL